jgi:hypothetical protein
MQHPVAGKVDADAVHLGVVRGNCETGNPVQKVVSDELIEVATPDLWVLRDFDVDQSAINQQIHVGPANQRRGTEIGIENAMPFTLKRIARYEAEKGSEVRDVPAIYRSPNQLKAESYSIDRIKPSHANG